MEQSVKVLQRVGGCVVVGHRHGLALAAIHKWVCTSDLKIGPGLVIDFEVRGTSKNSRFERMIG